MMQESIRIGLPEAQGLYDPAHEHDACGVGFVVNINGEKTHEIVRKGLEILINLSHRGACGCDPLTGDGAGILVQIPHAFFASQTAELGFALPAAGDYGIAMCFLPRDEAERRHCQDRLEKITSEEGQRFLGWRDVPVNSEEIGWLARNSEPTIRQAFIARGEQTPPDLLEWKLYVIRKRLENEIRGSQLKQKKRFYIPTFSSRVVIYKGLMVPNQAERYFNDLRDERFTSALALVHQRYSTNTFPSWELAHPFRFLAHNGEINTLRGNINWMRARESMLASQRLGEDVKKVVPVCTPGASDSAIFDNALELLVV
ncbi:MAG TPA: glutamate synthase subunit alpha, partial [Lacipirellulaceae bacterium]|nr:glutamate synthase subunit alpha [Lacipirellulaceae bacterium]